MKKSILFLFTFIALSFILSSCGDDDKDVSKPYAPTFNKDLFPFSNLPATNELNITSEGSFTLDHLALLIKGKVVNLGSPIVADDSKEYTFKINDKEEQITIYTDGAKDVTDIVKVSTTMGITIERQKDSKGKYTKTYKITNTASEIATSYAIDLFFYGKDLKSSVSIMRTIIEIEQ